MPRIKSAGDLFVYLVKLGFRYCKPVGRLWSSGLIFKHDTSVLCILFRKNGIDLRHYDNYRGEISINSRNMASFSNGKLFRNHYNEADTFIHLKVAAIASSFCAGTIREELTTQEGRSYRLNPRYQNLRERSRYEFQKRAQKMREGKEQRDIYTYIEEDCGGYLGDGEWL